MSAPLPALAWPENVELESQDHDRQVLTLKAQAGDLPAVARAIVAAGGELVEMRRLDRSLAEHYLRLLEA